MSQHTANSGSNYYGIGFTGLLTILFIALKLMGYITWSWVWILSPLWISALVAVSLLPIFLIFVGIIANK